MKYFQNYCFGYCIGIPSLSYFMFQENLAQSKILEAVVDDFLLKNSDDILSCVKSLLTLMSKSGFPSPAAVVTITVLVQIIGKLQIFFDSAEAASILDCVSPIIFLLMLI